MIDVIISSVIIIIIMIFFLFIMFKNIIKRINHNAKKYFINKLDNYNYMVEEKEKKIDELTMEIKELQKKKDELEDTNVLVTHSEEKIQINKKSIDIKVPEYREENFFVNYKELKQKFNFDKEKIIKDFIKEHINKKHEQDYKVLYNLKNKFSKETIYHLMTLTGEEQFEIIAKILTDKEKDLINLVSICKDKNEFNMMGFLRELNELMIKVDPRITIYVSKYDKNYDYIDPYIQTKHYSNMVEGIIIEYEGKRYDFSI